jgi:RHS repeat-associated protein
VAYTFGLKLDQPLSVIRLGYKNSFGDTWDPFSIVPLWTVRGTADTSYFAASGATNCKTAGHCVLVAYGSEYWTPAYSRYFVPTMFQGTLLSDKSDHTGQLYRRSRYYDPASGRFTQEDPLGLAGGMNLYGFVSGDPVNLSDPFGLFECDKKTGEGCSDEYKRLLKVDKPLETPLVDPIAIASGMLVGALLAPAEAALVGGINAVRAGQAGEAAVRGVADVGEKAAIRVGGRTRIPDGLTNTVLTEVKNVKSLSYTQQLRDFTSYAQANGLRFDLWVRNGAGLSGPLQQAIRNGAIYLRIIP